MSPRLTRVNLGTPGQPARSLGSVAMSGETRALLTSAAQAQAHYLVGTHVLLSVHKPMDEL